MTDFPVPPPPPLTLEDLAQRLAVLEELFRRHHHEPRGDARDELRHQIGLQLTGQDEEHEAHGRADS